MLQHAKAGSTDIGSDPARVYYFAELYSFNVKVSSAINSDIRSAPIRTSKIYRNLCDVPVLKLFTPLLIQLMK